MGTPFQSVYDAFMAKILDDEWTLWTEDEKERDMRALLMGAIPRFRFPRTPLTYEENDFVNELSNEEIQILATYMKCEWLNRTILTWENVKPLYTERDFSQANLLDKFRLLLESEKKNAKALEAIYYRVQDYKPFNYKNLAN
jgi:hypothetical protein